MNLKKSLSRPSFNNIGNVLCGRFLPIYHVVEYPKCGGTWMMRLLRSCFDEQTNGAQERLFLGGVRIYKRHTLYNSNIRRPLIMVRDPRDVWVSYYFHRIYHNQNASLRQAIEYHEKGCEKEQLTKFVKLHLNSPDKFHPYFSYEKFVLSWKEQVEKKEQLWIRYEDLHSNTLDILRQVVQHFSFRLEDKKLVNAISENTFEKASGGRKQGDGDPTSHKRKGIVGDWKNYFTDELNNYVFSKQAILFENLCYDK